MTWRRFRNVETAEIFQMNLMYSQNSNEWKQTLSNCVNVNFQLKGENYIWRRRDSGSVAVILCLCFHGWDLIATSIQDAGCRVSALSAPAVGNLLLKRQQVLQSKHPDSRSFPTNSPWHFPAKASPLVTQLYMKRDTPNNNGLHFCSPQN